MASFRKAFSKGITTINVKTDNFIEETKSKTHINTLESECEAIYTTIGKTAYQQWKDGSFSIDSVEPFLKEIQQKQYEISQEMAKIENLQKIEQEILGKKGAAAQGGISQSGEGQVFCTKCGSVNRPNYKFCCSCGAPLVK